MKKLFPGILALLLAFSCFAGCGEKTPDSSSPADSTPPASTPGDSTPDDSTPQVHDIDLRDVKNSIISELNDQNALSNKAYPIRNSFAFPNAPTVFYDVAWEAVDENGNAVPGVTIVEGDSNDTVNINVSDDVQYILKGTITCPEACCTTSFTLNARTASAAPVPVAIESAPEENVAYKLYVYEGSKGKDCFPTGETKKDNPWYWLTSTNYEEGIDIYAKNVAGGFNLYHVVDGTNVYLNIVQNGTHTNSLYQTLEENATPSVWTFDATMGTGTIVTTVEGKTDKFYLGCDGGYDTIEAQYKTGSTYYIAYLCTMKNKSEIVITDEDKVSTTLDELNPTLKYTLDKSNIILPTNGNKYQEVSVSWSVEADKGATLTQNILDLVIPAEKTTVVLTATVVCGDVTETKTFDLELGPKTVVTDSTDPAAILAAAFNLAPGEALEGKYTLTGEIKTIKTAYDEEYKNITVIITIGDKEMECFRLKGSDTTDASALKVGDTITVEGSIKNHYGTVEFDAGCILLEVTAGGGEEGGTDTPDPDPEVPEYAPMTLTEALAAAEGTKVEISGTVSEIYQNWNTQYNNMSVYITDGTTRIIVFRAEVQLGVGDVITVKGVITAYNNVNQIAEGSTVEITQAHTCTDFNEATCQAPATCTVCGTAQDGSVAVDHVYVEGVCKWCRAPEGVQTTTASKTMAELIVSEGWTSSTTKQSFNLDANVSVKVNGGNNTGKAYNDDHIRIYATDTPAGTLTISVAEGYELVSVKVTTQTGTYAFLYVDGTTTDICNQTVAVSGSSVVLNSVKNGSDGKQVRVMAIEVVYKAV